MITKSEMTKLNKAKIEDVLNPLVETAHTLIAGTTGSGKSVLLNDIIQYLQFRPAVFTFYDLKRVEFLDYNLNAPAFYWDITDPDLVLTALDQEIAMMEATYERMGNKKMTDEIPHYIVIDELADLMTIKGVTERLTKLGRLGRAANMHLLCATQDPSRRNLPAQLMQNFTCTVALRCRSAIESRQIIGVNGAEELPLYGYGYRWDYQGIQAFKVPDPNHEKLKIARMCMNGITSCDL